MINEKVTFSASDMQLLQQSAEGFLSMLSQPVTLTNFMTWLDAIEQVVPIYSINVSEAHIA